MEDEFDVANLIVKRLIGINVNFTYYSEIIYVNNYVTVGLSKHVSYSTSGDSEFRLGFDIGSYIPSISFDIFNINPRAEELSMKIDDIVEKGKVVVNSEFSYVKIIVVVEESSYDDISFSGTIGINIEIPRYRNYSINPQYSYEKEEKKMRLLKKLLKLEL